MSIRLADCRLCGKFGSWPGICMSTRDATEKAIALTSDRCYAAIQRQGGGEVGMKRIDAERLHNRRVGKLEMG